MNNPPIRIAIVEDEPLLRELLATSLTEQRNLTVVGAYGDARTALASIPGLEPDVVTLDIELGNGATGIDLGISLREVMPHLGIVLLSHHGRAELLASIPEESRGHWSYVLKGSLHDVQALVHTIEGAARGLVVLDPSFSRRGRRREDSLSVLTPRQMDVLALVAEACSNAEIAKRLLLSEKSVENHLSRIYALLGIRAGDSAVHARVNAARHYLARVSTPTD